MSRLCYSPRTVQASRVKHATHLQQTLYHITPTLHTHGTSAMDTYYTSQPMHNTPALLQVHVVTPLHSPLPFWPMSCHLTMHWPHGHAVPSLLHTPLPHVHLCHATDHTGSGLPPMNPTPSCTTMLLTTLSVPPHFPHHVPLNAIYQTGQLTPCPELCLVQGTTA